jgi:hypothetical protein
LDCQAEFIAMVWFGDMNFWVDWVDSNFTYPGTGLARPTSAPLIPQLATRNYYQNTENRDQMTED